VRQDPGASQCSAHGVVARPPWFHYHCRVSWRPCGWLVVLTFVTGCATATTDPAVETAFETARACAHKFAGIDVRRGADGRPEFYFSNDRQARSAHLTAAKGCYRDAGAAPSVTAPSGASAPLKSAATPAGPPPPATTPTPAPASQTTARPATRTQGEGPIIAIAAPVDGARMAVDHVQLVGAVAAPGGLTRVEIEVNERLLPTATRDIAVRPRQSPTDERSSPVESQASINLSERIALIEGVNRIVVRASDRTGATTSRLVTITREVTRGHIWAVVIGISRYKAIQSLGFADRDAAAVRDFLVQHLDVPTENVTLLTNEQATLIALKHALGTDLRRKAGEKDTVIIYYAGHGAPESDASRGDDDGLEKYLVPHDADPTDLYTTALPMREVETVLSRLSAERVVFITDSCYSGATGGRTFSTGSRRAVVSDAFLARLAGARGRIVLTASRASEVSEERANLGHGVFTYYLLEGLRGAADADGDGLVTVDEAYAYVSSKVSVATGQNQHPQKKGEMEGPFFLGRVKR
jgi:hypothetical protein